MTFAAFWDRYRAWLLPALRDATEPELVRQLLAGQAQVWPGETGAIVTQVLADEDGRSLNVWLAGGNLAGVLALAPGIEAWARAMGCAWVSIDGRRGWTRVLRNHGYRRVGGELRKAL